MCVANAVHKRAGLCRNGGFGRLRLGFAAVTAVMADRSRKTAVERRIKAEAVSAARAASSVGPSTSIARAVDAKKEIGLSRYGRPLKCGTT